MRRVLRVLALAVCAIVLGSLQAVVLLLTRRANPRAALLPRLFHRATCAVLGIRVHVAGERSRAAQTVWVSNHLSYLDMGVLGSLLPGLFVAKHEVRGWPVFGFMSRLQRTVFIGRRATDTVQAIDSMASALDEGANLILFPEGTTTDGSGVLPFRSAAFALLIAPTTVDRVLQPVTIAVARSSDDASAPYAYYGDDVLVPHLGHFLRRGHTDVSVTLHAPIPVAAFAGDRKDAARRLHDTVASALPQAS